MSDNTITVDDEFISAGNEIINRLWDNLPENADDIECEIKPCIVQVLRHDGAKTFKYILLTQLLGKAVDDRVNILTMEASSPMDAFADWRYAFEEGVSIHYAELVKFAELLLGYAKELAA